jgi:hypothetical protein
LQQSAVLFVLSDQHLYGRLSILRSRARQPSAQSVQHDFVRNYILSVVLLAFDPLAVRAGWWFLPSLMNGGASEILGNQVTVTRRS